MKSVTRKIALVAAMVFSPAVVAAEPPDLSTYLAGSRAFFLAAGAGSFDVQFLFSRAGNTNSFFYQVDGLSWVGLFTIPGSSPTVPAAAPAGNPFTINVTPVGIQRDVRFAICQGNTTVFANCAGAGPFITGAGATNVRALTVAEYNVARGGSAALATNDNITSVIGFEDLPLGSSDGDFSDIIVGVSAQRIGVPEPSSYALVAAGLAALAMVSRRRRNTLV